MDTEAFSMFERHPHRPPAPLPAHGYLVQKIIASERRVLPSVQTELCPSGCHTGTLQSVTASGAAVCTVCGGRMANVTIPVCLAVCDACGCCARHSASVEVQTALPSGCQWTDEPGTTLLALPCVRLMHAAPSGSGCFCAQLHITLDLYLLRWELCGCMPPKPVCPQLPLYPQPRC